jgi:hypothetical protein
MNVETYVMKRSEVPRSWLGLLDPIDVDEDEEEEYFEVEEED